MVLPADCGKLITVEMEVVEYEYDVFKRGNDDL